MTGTTLGERIRVGRQSKKLSLRDLSARLGISPSHLSKIENGKTYPSVTSLHALVTELGMSLDELFANDAHERIDPPGHIAAWRAPTKPSAAPDAPVQHAGDRPVFEVAGGFTVESLSNLLRQSVAARLMTYPPGSRSTTDGRLRRHNGTEFGYIIEGTLTLKLGSETLELSAGDAPSFDSTIPHLYVNTSDTPAVGVWFQVPILTETHGDPPLGEAMDSPFSGGFA